MPRLLIHVEGETEETFVNRLLSAHLYGCGYSFIAARLLGNQGSRARRGGIRNWEASLRDIVRHLKEDRKLTTSLIVDFYGMPNDWPGRRDAEKLSAATEKASCIEQKLVEAVKVEA